ncbi:hypothetical protein J4216_06115 [Candidatus Woesearchaeota archaeon]|nr:hypothetical protein [Candidatus Woesearchaeota archaeon]
MGSGVKKSLPEMLMNLRILAGGVLRWSNVGWGDLEVLCLDTNSDWYFKYGDRIYKQPKNSNKGGATCYSCGSEIYFIPASADVISALTSSGTHLTYDSTIIELPYCMECDSTIQ